jgi:putative endonuclease
MHYVYVLVSKSADPESYIGETADLRRRFEQHNSGKNTSTRGRQWRLAYYEAYVSKSAARKRERLLKQDGRSRRFLMQRVWDSLSEDDVRL